MPIPKRVCFLLYILFYIYYLNPENAHFWGSDCHLFATPTVVCLPLPCPVMMLTMRCACKRQHTDRSEVTNGYGVLCGCESGIFENVPTSEGEECKVCSIKTRARLARNDSECDSGDNNECNSGNSGECESE